MKYIYIIIALVVLGLLIWLTLIPTFFSATNQAVSTDPNDDTAIIPDSEMTDDSNDDTADEQNNNDASLTENTETVIGQSAGGNDIVAYHYGSGDTEILLVAGIHGGYSWNTTALGYELMNHLESIENDLEAVRITVIPTLNPDGLETVFGTVASIDFASAPTVNATIPGRFNAHEVDLNRNFDCQWQASGTWQNQTVSGGSQAFSEPETQAIRDYVEANDIAGAIAWYSAAGGVYSSNCGAGVLPATTIMTNTYAEAAGYPAYAEYDYYEITGDMVNWFSKQGIPAISVLLSDHQSTEASKNIAGLTAIIDYFANN